MGYMRHHAIVVTSWDEQLLDQVRDQIVALDEADLALTSSIVDGPSNGFQSFFIAPDGSKEGWPESDAGDRFRDAAVEVLRSVAYSDGSSSVDWCEVQFGDDNDDNRVVRSSGQES
jgi:hypothetical protein